MFWKKLKKKAAEKHNYDLTYDNVAIPEVHTHKPEDHEIGRASCRERV